MVDEKQVEKPAVEPAKTEAVKPSESSSEKKPEPKPEASAAKATETQTVSSANGDSSSATKKLLEQALEDVRKERDRREKLEMRIAEDAEQRARLRRVFKPGFKVAKQR